MTDHAKKTDPAPRDAAVAVSVSHLDQLLDAAEKHAAKDPELAAAIANLRG